MTHDVQTIANEVAHLLDRLTDAEQAVQELPRSERWLKPMQELRDRIRRQKKLVAVFGAFSAGKSSLINAILGDNVLVVSPNPTTAAVTEISWEDDSPALKVRAKSAEQVQTDVRQALRYLGRDAESLEGAISMAAALKMADFSPAARRHVSFLKAVANGYAHMQERLGQVWTASIEEVRRFTADEKFACFIERVDLTHEAPFLQSGAILTDTPGVDSIHRRHTDVAFNYMRNADAVIFVLYYTHAFSRADREFLQQLAAVQDVLGTNKLFVVLNAVDLATDEEERAAVEERVRLELRRLGLMDARIYGVSSQLAFAAERLRQGDDSAALSGLIRQRLQQTEEQELPDPDELSDYAGVHRLVDDLEMYLSDRSADLARESVARSLRNLLEQLSSRRRAALQQRQADAATLEAQKQERALVLRWLEDQRGAVEQGDFHVEQMLQREWDELVFHMGERIRLKYSSMFRESFHPGRFRGGRDKEALREGAMELCEALARQIEAECRTFALRAHSQVETGLTKEWERVLARLVDVGFQDLVAHEPLTFGDVPTLYRRAEIDASMLEPYFRTFRSAKQFFEEGGSADMLRASEEPMQSVVLEEIADLAGHLRQQLITHLRAVWGRWIEPLHAQAADALLGDADISADEDPLWESVVAKMQQILASIPQKIC